MWGLRVYSGGGFGCMQVQGIGLSLLSVLVGCVLRVWSCLRRFAPGSRQSDFVTKPTWPSH